MVAVALIVGSPFLSWIANRIGRKPALIGCSVLLTAVCGVFYAFTDRLTLPWLYMMFFFFSLSGAATGPVVAAISKELFPVSIAGTSVGTVNVFPFFGGALFQVFVGAILTRGGHDGGGYSVAGYQDMFLIYLVGALISLLAAAFLRETLGKENRSRAGNSLPSI